MKAKILKNEADYEAALEHAAALMDAAPGSSEEDELELFSLLIEQYEKEHYPIAPPDPIDAILFRMDQEGLKRKDMTPYFGTQSRVSEVLNRNRPLTLAMIRNLHEGLGIPADVLLQKPGKQLDPPRFNVDEFPLKEMLKCGYFRDWDRDLRATKEHAEELLTKLFAVFRGQMPELVLCRRSASDLNESALKAWQAHVLSLVENEPLPAYNADALDSAFFTRFARASFFPDGPKVAADLLNKYGIHFVVCPHLAKTYLDGACFLAPTGHPVIGVTLRHDRLDNFWFTLAHEIAHVHLHLDESNLAFFDEVDGNAHAAADSREAEADAFARDLLIPADAWAREGPTLVGESDDEAVTALAEELEIAPAIIAGRIRWETGDYTRHHRLIGNKKVRMMFSSFT